MYTSLSYMATHFYFNWPCSPRLQARKTKCIFSIFKLYQLFSLLHNSEFTIQTNYAKLHSSWKWSCKRESPNITEYAPFKCYYNNIENTIIRRKFFFINQSRHLRNISATRFNRICASNHISLLRHQPIALVI